MRKLYIAFLIIFFNSLIFSQATVQVKLAQPPPNDLSINDLWNATLINSDSNAIKITLLCALEKSGSGLIAEGSSDSISLDPGTRTITYDDVKSGNASTIFDRWGKLNTGSGDYIISIQIFNASGAEIGSDSISQRVEIPPFDVLEVALNKITFSDSTFYQLLITNNYTGDLPDNKPKSFRITADIDSILSISGGVPVGWERTPSKFPPGSSGVVWVNTSGEVPIGTTDLGNIYFGNLESEPIDLTYEWRNNNDDIIYSKTIILGQADACITWDLLSDESVTSTVGNILGVSESISVGPAPTMSVFNYNSNGQRLWVGNTGWVAGNLETTRYIEFNTSPVSGNNLNVTNVSFNYGDNQIDRDFFILNSQVFYSIDNWVTSTALSQTALVYLNTSMSTFSATNLNIAVISGQTFSLRIYPYAVQNGSAMTPTFAIHNNVVVCGISTTSHRIASIEISDLSEKWDKSVLLTAKLEESGVTGSIALSNRIIKFYVDNKYVDSDSTNSSGIASVSYYIPMPSDSVTNSITALFESDSIFSSQISTSFLTVQKHTTNLSFEVESDSIGQSLMLKASLTDSDSIGTRISNREVKFFVDNKYVDSDSTNSSGGASISYYIPSSSDSVNLYIKASFTGDAAYDKSEATHEYNKYDPDAGCSKVWESLGRGADGQVSVILEMGGDVYAGGSFINAGGTVVNHIAKWDGTVWSPLGSGINGDVNALAVLGTDLYAGGYFTAAGGVSASSIAKWDGSNWSALGSGINDTVKALVVINDDLYAAGNFTDAGGITASNIAKWDGTSWSTLGEGLNIDTRSLAVIGSDLYAGGKKIDHDMDDAVFDLKNIAKWDGTSWSTLANGLNIDINTLAVIGSDLYAGGKKKDYDWDEAVGDLKNIAKWDGASWSTLGNGLNIDINTLAVLGSDLYAGGLKKKKDMDWDEAAGDLNNIAKWDGSSWSALGTGMNQNYVQTIAAVGGDLYAGGWFNTADGISASNIAKFSCSSVTAIDEIKTNQNLPKVFKLEQNYPNPFNPSSTIKYDIPKNSFVKIIVYDILGREIKILLNEEKSPGSYEINFDAKHLASGIYFYTIKAGEFSQSRKMILLK